MAGTKAAQNAGEAAARTARAAGRTVDAPNPQSVADLSQASRAALVDSATKRNLGVTEAFELDYKFVPALEQAGYPAERIKAMLASDSPHTEIRQFIADETDAMTAALRASPKAAGLDPSKMRFQDLKSTYDSLAAPGERPSNLRGKVEDSGPVESGNDSDVPRTPAPPMDETPTRADEAGAAAAKAEPKDREGRGFYSDGGIRSGGPGFFREEARPPVPNFESMISPGSGIQKPTMVDIAPAEPPTPPMQELINYIDRQGTDPSKPKQATRQAAARAASREALAGNPSKVQLQTADPSAAPALTGDAFYAGANMPTGAQRIGVVEQRPQSDLPPASPGVQPAVADEVAPKPAAPSDELPAAVKNSRILKAARGAAGNVGRNWFDYAVGGSVVGLPTAYGLGLFGGSKQQPAAGPQGQATPSGQPPVQINILPREALRQLEQRRPAPQQMAPPPQAPMQSPQQAPAGNTTDIIRQLSGRMV